MKEKMKKRNLLGIWVTLAALICVSGVLMFIFVSYSKSLGQQEVSKEYDKYYVMIADDPKASLWQSVYESAFNAGLDQNIYVEMLSDRFSENYTKYQLMEIAIASKVDGIILSADESDEMTQLINSAMKKKIPVVTVFSDNANSARISFVGIGNYNLGKEYGNLISELSEAGNSQYRTIKVSVLVDSNSRDSSQNVLYAAIQEAVEEDSRKHPYSHSPISLSLYSVDATNRFSVEESVRGLLQKKDDLPDVVVCLNEIDTTSVYQAVVDYNEVGKISILGYYDSEAILKGIERNVIYSTISVDTAQLGQFSIDALNEYHEMGNTSQYFTADVSIIKKSNVSAHLKEGATDEE